MIPLPVAPQAVTAALLAVGAVALWAVGTVLGRLVSVSVTALGLRERGGKPVVAVA